MPSREYPGRPAPVGRLEPDPSVEGDDDRVRDHRVVGLQVVPDLGDVREDLRPLVALDRRCLLPLDPGDGRESREQLPVDREADRASASALPDLDAPGA